MSKKQELTEEEVSKTSAEKAVKNDRDKSQKKPGLSERIQNFKEYLLLSRVELRKVSWPTLKETRTTSLVVLGFVTVMALLLGLVDLVLSSFIQFILS